MHDALHAMAVEQVTLPFALVEGLIYGRTIWLEALNPDQATPVTVNVSRTRAIAGLAK